MRGRAWSVAVLLSSVVLSAPGGGAAAGAPATLAAFAVPWEGHDRVLTITRSGRASETILESCCQRAIGLRFRITKVFGTRIRPLARAMVTYVHVYDRSAYSQKHPPPHVGQVGTLRIVSGVLHEPFGDATY